MVIIDYNATDLILIEAERLNCIPSNLTVSFLGHVGHDIRNIQWRHNTNTKSGVESFRPLCPLAAELYRTWLRLRALVLIY